MMLTEDRILLYIDILGFTELVKNSEANKTDNLQEKILDVLRDLASFKDMYEKSFDEIGIKISMFSDTIVFSDTWDKDKISVFVSLAATIQKNLLQLGYATRGVIHKGLLYHDSKNHIIFGSGLIKAYTIERDEVKFPRVILSLDLINQINTSDYTQIGLIKDEDGAYYVDFIYRGSYAQITASDLHPNEALKVLLQNLLSTVKSNTDKFCFDPKVHEKWEWLNQFLSKKMGLISIETQE